MISLVHILEVFFRADVVPNLADLYIPSWSTHSWNLCFLCISLNIYFVSALLYFRRPPLPFGYYFVLVSTAVFSVPAHFLNSCPCNSLLFFFYVMSEKNF